MNTALNGSSEVWHFKRGDVIEKRRDFAHELEIESHMSQQITPGFLISAKSRTV